VLPFPEFKQNIVKWRSERDFKSIKISATKRLEALGYVDLGIGSFKRWIKEEWFEKAKRLDVIRKKDDVWMPLAVVRYEEEPVGKKGDSYIYGQRKEVLDYSKFFNFMAEMQAEEDRERTGQNNPSDLRKGISLNMLHQQALDLKKKSLLKAGDEK